MLGEELLTSFYLPHESQHFFANKVLRLGGKLDYKADTREILFL